MIRRKAMLIDSNVIIHLFRKDIPHQEKTARDFLKKIEAGVEEGNISILVLDEIIHVLGEFYGIERSEFIPNLIKILTIKNIEVVETKKESIIQILEKMIGNKIDFTDYYLATIAPKGQIFSFDQDFKKLQFKLLAKS